MLPRQRTARSCVRCLHWLCLQIKALPPDEDAADAAAPTEIGESGAQAQVNSAAAAEQAMTAAPAGGRGEEAECERTPARTMRVRAALAVQTQQEAAGGTDVRARECRTSGSGNGRPSWLRSSCAGR
eukprot:5468388-Pleurochrysis_carterae.AAC.10